MVAAPSLFSPCDCQGVGADRVPAPAGGGGAREGTNDSAKAKGTKAATLPQIILKVYHQQADNGGQVSFLPFVEGKPRIRVSM